MHLLRAAAVLVCIQLSTQRGLRSHRHRRLVKEATPAPPVADAAFGRRQGVPRQLIPGPLFPFGVHRHLLGSYAARRAAVALYRSALQSLLDADATYAAKVRGARLLYETGGVPQFSRHAILHANAAQLCRSILVLNCGDVSLNGMYVSNGTNDGVPLYELLDPSRATVDDYATDEAGITKKLRYRQLARDAQWQGSAESTILFRLKGSGSAWWNIRSTAGVQYGAFALGVSPPENGWGSKVFGAAFQGSAGGAPVVLPVALWFARECDARNARRGASFDALLSTGRDIPALPAVATRFLAYTLGTDQNRARQHIAGARRHGLDLHVLPGPWVNYVKSKSRDGICGTQLLAARPDDILLYADGYDAAWACSGPQLEKVLVQSGRPILVAAEQAYWCPGCDETLKRAFERQFWPLRSVAARRHWPTFKYLNAGALVARAGALTVFCDEMERHGWHLIAGDQRPDDQATWYEFSVSHPELVAVDFEQRMMSTVYSDHELEHTVRKQPDSQDAVQCSVQTRHDGLLVNSCSNGTTCGVHAAGSCHVTTKDYRCPELDARMEVLGFARPTELITAKKKD